MPATRKPTTSLFKIKISKKIVKLLKQNPNYADSMTPGAASKLSTLPKSRL